MTISTQYPEIKPSLNLDFANTRELDPRVDFTRASNATYYDGSMHKAEENLFSHSQEFESVGWAGGNRSLTPNSAVAPDGTNTATTLTANGASSIGHNIVYSTGDENAEAATFSIYAKAGTKSVVQILFYGGSQMCWQNFDLNSGVLGNGSISNVYQLDQSITDVGNGWYRLSITVNCSVTPAAHFVFSIKDSVTSDRAATETNSGTVYIWGAQWERRSFATAYTPTTGTPITNYQPTLITASANQPRFEIDPISKESKGLLIEEPRTNLVTHSSDFASAFWEQARSSITSNTIVAPDGTFTGDKLVEDTTSGLDHRTVLNGNTSTTGQTYTFSVFAKAAERKGMRITFSASRFASNYSAYYDLENGVVTSGAAYSTIEPIGNGWYRCTLTTTATADGLFANGIYPTVNGTTYYDGDGSSGIYIWGAQLEKGTFPTSYIPTAGAAVTRTGDSASMTGENFSSWYRQNEGTVYSEMSASPNKNQRGYTLSDGTSNNKISLIITTSGGTGNWPEIRAIDATVQTSASSGGSLVPVAGEYHSSAVAFALNDFATSRDGASVVSDTSVLLPVGIHKLSLGADANGTSGSICGHIKKFAYYPKRVSNEQLESLTK